MNFPMLVYENFVIGSSILAHHAMQQSLCYDLCYDFVD